jgi:hypothetical protein
MAIYTDFQFFTIQMPGHTEQTFHKQLCVDNSSQLHVYICPERTSSSHKAEKYYSNRISAIAKHHEARSNQATLNSTENAIFLQCKGTSFRRKIRL